MLKKRLPLSVAALLTCCAGLAQGWPSAYGGVMLQGFSWNSFSDTQWSNLAGQAGDMQGYIDLLWIPNAGQCQGTNQMGYSPYYFFPVGNNYTSSFGTLTDLRAMVTAMRNAGIGVIGDVVINHHNTSGWFSFPAETYNGTTYQLQSTDIVADDDDGAAATQAATQGVTLSSNNDSGDGWDGMRDLDHHSTNVQNYVKAYLSMLKNDLGYKGFRYDMVSGFDPSYIGIYNTYAAPEFSVGECWKNDDVIRAWIDGTKVNGTPTSAAFDFQFRYTIRNAINNNDWRKLNQANTGSQGWPLVSSSNNEGSYRQWAITFVENHDTQYRDPRNTNDPITTDTLAANAYMLAMPGTPCVFYPHWKDYKNEIKNMIAIRKMAGITNTSVPIVRTDNNRNYYVVSTQGTVVTLRAAVGPGAASYTNPSTSEKLVAEGHHYKYYLGQSNSLNKAWLTKPSGDYVGAFDVTAVKLSRSENFVLVYTTDGTDPIASSAQIADGGTIHVDQDMTVKIALYNTSTGRVNTSSMETRHYTVTPASTYSVTVYLKDPNDYLTGQGITPWSSVYCKIFDTSDNNNDTADKGIDITASYKMVDGVKYYYRTLESTDPDYHCNLLFNNGSWGNDNQISNLNSIVDVANGNEFFFEIYGGGGDSMLQARQISNPEEPQQTYTVTLYLKDPNAAGGFLDTNYSLDGTNGVRWNDVMCKIFSANGYTNDADNGVSILQNTKTVHGELFYYRTFEAAAPFSFGCIFWDGSGTWNSTHQTANINGVAATTQQPSAEYYYEITGMGTGNNPKLTVTNVTETYSQPEPTHTATVYFKLPSGHDWGNEINCYAWDDGSVVNESWPGPAAGTTTVDGVEYYYRTFTIPTSSYSVNVIFNNNNHGKQTVNITGVSQDTFVEFVDVQDDYGHYAVKDPSSSFTPHSATVFFKDPGWSSVYYYVWDNDGNQPFGGWAGREATKTVTINGDTWRYSVLLFDKPNRTFNVIFNNNSGTQTENITGITGDVYYQLKGDQDGENHEKVETVTPVFPTATVHFKQPESGWDNVRFHAWGSDGWVRNANGTALHDDWFNPAPLSVKYIDGEPWFYRTFVFHDDNSRVNMVIHNGNGTQTVDITNVTQDVYYTLSDNTDDSNHHYVDNAGDMTEVLTGIALKHHRFFLGLNATMPLEATVSGTHVCSPVVWTSSNEDIVTVTGGTPRPASNGPRRSAAVDGMMYGAAVNSGSEGGWAVITATVGDFSDQCDVFVDVTTGQAAVTAGEALVSVEDGRLVINSPRDTRAQLVSPDGRVRTVTVRAGVNTYDFTGPILLVKLENKTHKLRK